jgi:transposase
VEVIHRYSKLPKPPYVNHRNTSSFRDISHSSIHCIQRRFSPETIALVVADYQTGLSTAALMQRYHIGKSAVLGILNRAGVIRHQKTLSDEQLAEAAELYRQGWSLVQLSEHLDTAQTTVWRGLKRMGVDMRKPWERGQSTTS